MPHFIDKNIMAELQATWPEYYDATSRCVPVCPLDRIQVFFSGDFPLLAVEMYSVFATTQEDTSLSPPSHRFRSPKDMQMSFAYFYYVMSARKDFDLEELFRDKVGFVLVEFQHISTANWPLFTPLKIVVFSLKKRPHPTPPPPPQLDMNRDGVLDENEVTQLALLMQNNKVKPGDNIKLAGELRNATADAMVREWAGLEQAQQPRERPDPASLPITVESILAHNATMEKLNELMQAKRKYKHTKSDLDQVDFYMIGDNSTLVKARLDEIKAKVRFLFVLSFAFFNGESLPFIVETFEFFVLLKRGNFPGPQVYLPQRRHEQDARPTAGAGGRAARLL